MGWVTAHPYKIPTVGAVAQLGERVNGIHEVRGSIPLGSTIFPNFPKPCISQAGG